MAACWAASSRSTQFSRGLCMSPSVWWNYGELSTIIAQNYESTQLLPKSIFISIGSQEAYSWMDLGPNVPVVQWNYFLQSVTDSFENIGMGSNAPRKSIQMHPDGSYFPSVESNLAYVIYEGGMHDTVNMVDLFSYVVSTAYAYDYPSVESSKQAQRNSLLQIKYPHQNQEGDTTSNDTLVIGLSTALAFVSCLCFSMGLFIYISLRRRKEGILKSGIDSNSQLL